MKALAIEIDGAPGSMASVVVPRNAMLAKNKAVLAAAHLFAVRNECISPALAVRTFKSLIWDLRYPAVNRRTGQYVSFSLCPRFPNHVSSLSHYDEIKDAKA
ncbi:hypothetical protein ACVWWO_002235 [Bradyrhizobium sp. F1.13.1]